MSVNQSIKSIGLGTIQKGASQIAVEVALQTQKWTRVESVIDKTKYKTLVENTDKALPAGTTRAAVREFEHESSTPNHVDVVCYNKENKYINTEHIPAK
ncbi:hypothetical protein MMC30_007929 [Trapelia coarctata]|nr:hypothetical protein [Trapelia coarctata]